MRIPKKVYVLVSDKTSGACEQGDAHFSKKEATVEMKRRNGDRWGGDTNKDWRIKTYVEEEDK